jgi:hypothetical protein
MKILTTSLALAISVALGACSATTGTVGTRPAQHAITATNASSGKITSVRAFETGNTLYVAGTAHRSSGHSILPGAHIDIALLDRAGRVIATQQDHIVPVHPRQERRQAGRYSFAIGFPLATGRNAERIRITYHPQTHS